MQKVVLNSGCGSDLLRSPNAESKESVLHLISESSRSISGCGMHKASFARITHVPGGRLHQEARAKAGKFQREHPDAKTTIQQSMLKLQCLLSTLLVVPCTADGHAVRRNGVVAVGSWATLLDAKG